MTARDDLAAVSFRELTTTVAAAYGSQKHLTARYNQAVARILAAADAWALEVADTPELRRQRRQALKDELARRTT